MVATRKAKRTKAKRKATQTKAKQTKAKQSKAMQTKTYEILDNGSVPYLVEITPTTCIIYSNKHNEIYRTSYEHVFLGNKTGRLHEGTYQKGSSILVQQSPTDYVYIGSEIYSFRTKEPILAYESLVGPSSVPYPYAIGQDHTYFMLDKEMVPNHLLDQTKDAYGQFYGYTVSKTDGAAIEKKKTAFAFISIASAA